MAKTIEERFAQECLTLVTNPQYTLTIDAVKFATEQDRIARAEERDRCIKAMRDAYIKVHGSPCMIETIEKLARKAMEGGDHAES